MTNKKTAKLATISDINRSIDAATDIFAFKLTCKNTGDEHDYDFTEFSQHEYIAQHFIEAIHATSDKIGHATRLNQKSALKKFFYFLYESGFYSEPINHLNDITIRTLKAYASYLKHQVKDICYTTKAEYFYDLRPLVDWIALNNPAANKDLELPRGQFPKSDRMSESKQSYTKKEWESILLAVGKELKQRKINNESHYEPTMLGQQEPLDDIAPLTKSGTPSLWASNEYREWWWANNVGLVEFSTRTLKNITGGQALLSALSKHGDSLVSFRKHVTDNKNTILDKYKDKSCPIYKYKWESFEYCVWYFENMLNCEALTPTQVHDDYGDFYHGLRMYQGGIEEFYNNINVFHQLTADDIFPYYALLAIRTALNPSSLQSLTTDCLKQIPGVDEYHYVIDYSKIRAFKEDKTIPLQDRNDTYAGAIINRVIELTNAYRNNSTNLWVTSRSGNLSPEMFSQSARNFALKHKLYNEKLDKKGNKTILELRIDRLRPSIAMREYLRTKGNMGYIKTLLGQKYLTTTTKYLNDLDNPELQTNIMLHQEAFILSLNNKNTDIKTEIRDKFSCTDDELETFIYSENDNDCELNQCKDKLNSPQPGNTKGELCITGNACLSCQNCVITEKDIFKLFCMTAYYKDQLDKDIITEDYYFNIVGQYELFYEQEIIPKFDNRMIEQLSARAKSKPLPQWRLN